MSLGLDDLKKKRRKGQTPAETDAKFSSDANTSRASEPGKSETFPAGAWSKTHTTLPWSQTGLSKKSMRPSRKASRADAFMNEDWISVHTPPLFWFDIPADSKFKVFQEKLARLEEHLQATLRGPIYVIRRLYRQAIG